ncbi:MAG: pyridoxamine 5-phosphate oxidase [Verrucomicrobiota bacterium]|jgi:pyridoxamine 5'-phosphate oxidase
MSLAELRREYTQSGLHERDLDRDPMRQFQRWLHEAMKTELPEANAMTLATVGTDGQPSTRTVLLKALDARGFSFFTNYDSRKGRELEANPRAAITFAWLQLERQVNIEGRVAKLTREESTAYFNLRPRGSRLGAWASQQSEIIASRDVLEARMAQLESRYPGDDIPPPPNWGGYLLVPARVEFWQGRPSRLHDRLLYCRQSDDSWTIQRLSP